MTRERLRSALQRDSGLALAMAAGLRDSEIVELIGLAGYDAVLIDMEHSAFSFETVAEMICRADLAGISSLVRVPSNDPKTILRLLDVGADGIFVPHIRGVEDAREAVRAVRYPPLGSRGAVSTARAARFGTVEWPEHVAASNRDIVLAVMVEDYDVVVEVEGIAALEGLDLVFVGPFDLATSMGVFERNNPEVRKVVHAIAERVRSVGRAGFGLPLNHAAMTMDVPELIELGASFAWCAPGPQVMLLSAFRTQVSAARAKMDGVKRGVAATTSS